MVGTLFSLQRFATARLGVLVLLTVLISIPCQAYEEDVHFGLTRWLAIQAGFSPEEADTIATGDVQMDGAALDARTLVLNYGCVVGDVVGSNLVRDHHFASDVRAPASPKARTVKVGSQYGYERALDRIKNPLSNRRDSLLEFGDRLHAFQDTWSHQGEPDIPKIWPLRCRADYAWGHPKARGGWLRHEADQTATDLKGAVAMAHASYTLLCLHRNQVDKKPCTVSWANLQKDVDAFALAKTKIGKRDWFKSKGFADTRFVDNISLPESDRPIPLPYFGIQRNAAWSLPDSNPKVVANDEASKFFLDFFTQWATTRNFDKLSDQFVDQVEFGVKGSGDGLQKADKSLIKLTLQFWRILDHGSIPPAGHQFQFTTRPELVSNARTLLTSLTQIEGMLRPYETIAQAFLPMNKDGAPFLLAKVTAQGKDILFAIAKFRHAPHDTLLVSAQGKGRDMKVTAIQHVVED